MSGIWIKSQDRNTILLVNKFDVREVFGHYEITGNEIVIGKYDILSVANSVMNEIESAIKDDYTLYQMPEDYSEEIKFEELAQQFGK